MWILFGKLFSIFVEDSLSQCTYERPESQVWGESSGRFQQLQVPLCIRQWWLCSASPQRLTRRGSKSLSALPHPCSPCSLPASPVQLSSQHCSRAYHGLSALFPGSGHSGLRLLSSTHADPSCGQVQTFPETQAFQEEDSSHSQPRSHVRRWPGSHSLDTA